MSKLVAGGESAPAVSAPAGELGVEVEALHDGVVLEVAPGFAGHGPEHLELDAVGVFSVERLAHAVVALSDERTEAEQAGAHRREVLDRVDFPGQVIEAGAALLRPGRLPRRS